MILMLGRAVGGAGAAEEDGDARRDARGGSAWMVLTTSSTPSDRWKEKTKKGKIKKMTGAARRAVSPNPAQVPNDYDSVLRTIREAFISPRMYLFMTG